MSRLRKRDVEALFDRYDSDPVGALTEALRRLLDQPEGSWQELLTAATIGPERRALLEQGQTQALDDLARELNEQRTL